MDRAYNATSRRILTAALRQFADCGYTGASVQTIVDQARITKPTLYYYYKSKAGLFQAVLDWAYDERFRVMQKAASRGSNVRDQLVSLLTGLFGFLRDNAELMRLAFTTAFASAGEIPSEVKYLHKAQRNFDLIHELIRKGVVIGEITSALSSQELAINFYGMLNVHVMSYLFDPKTKIDRRKAERVVQLFFEGAAA